MKPTTFVLSKAIVVGLLFVNTVISKNSQILQWVRNDVMCDYVIDSRLLIRLVVRSRMECTVLCVNDVACASFFYNTASKVCQTHDVIFVNRFDGREETSWQYYADKGCVAGWLLFRRHCYLFDRSRQHSWYEAKSKCFALGAYLTEITSQEENDFVIQSITSSVNNDDFFWFGGNDLDTEGTWIWSFSREIFGFARWYNGGYDSYINTQISPQPDNFQGKEHCLNIYPRWNYEWNDELCSSTMYAACEKPKD